MRVGVVDVDAHGLQGASRVRHAHHALGEDAVAVDDEAVDVELETTRTRRDEALVERAHAVLALRAAQRIRRAVRVVVHVVGEGVQQAVDVAGRLGLHVVEDGLEVAAEHRVGLDGEPLLDLPPGDGLIDHGRHGSSLGSGTRVARL